MSFGHLTPHTHKHAHDIRHHNYGWMSSVTFPLMPAGCCGVFPMCDDNTLNTTWLAPGVCRWDKSPGLVSHSHANWWRSVDTRRPTDNDFPNKQTEMVHQQLRALSILDTAIARQKGYPQRVSFQEFIRR